MLLPIAAAALIVLATVFNLVAVLGYKRLPDVYTRLHAAGMAATFGTTLLLLATPLVIEANLAKVFLLVALLLIAAPVASHAVASAALRVGERQTPLPGDPPPPDALHD